MKVVGLAGWSGAGKTTLLTRLIPHLNARGLRVSTLKHAHHDFEIDQPGKDSWRHRQAGAHEVMVASSRRFAIIHELRGAPEPDLPQLLKRLALVDLVIVEGFKRAPYAKIEIFRSANEKPLLCDDDPTIVGIAGQGISQARVPIADLDDIDAVAAMVLAAARSVVDPVAD